ncbi:MAG: methyltransferase [bacterium]
MTSLSTTLSALKLKRFPPSNNPTLKAFNAADEYLLEAIHDKPIKDGGSVLIINDQFGALSCSLAQHQPSVWTDSYLSQTAINQNLRQHSLEGAVNYINQTDLSIPDDALFKHVFIRIPKHNSLLAYQLSCIKNHLHPNCQIIGAGMTKEIHRSNILLFEQIIGPTTTSLAKKKARLILANQNNEPHNHSELQHCLSFDLPKQDIKVIGLPGVFSRDKLDIGSRLLLRFLPDTQGNQKLIDLGCGTGILGTAAAMKNQHLQVCFTDESWLAIESAKQTYLSNIKNHKKANFYVTHVLGGLDNNTFDHILCNPPFHQQNVQTLAIANKMFKDSAQKLTSDGELRVVANRHLPYSKLLSRYFHNVDVISNDPKFIVWLAHSPKKRS